MRGHQTHRQTLLTGTSGAADAVGVNLRVARQLVVDHCGELLDVEAARGHIGGNQHRNAPVGKAHQYLIALPLLKVAMDRQRRETMLDQGRGHFLALHFGVAEDQRRFRMIVPEDARYRCRPLLRFYFKEDLLDSALVMGLIDTDLDRLVLEGGAEGGNFRRVGGGEEQGLFLGRGGGNERTDIILKTHVEHAVCLIKDQRLQ